ncbi:hypothetical protein IFM89_006091 [Coptis chinensis]|uniref:FAR1 domain-containing protein n=1 Tax=Coptis chinensis TaxID=261450 RepID=A0A835LEJ5_9MAGN|nr:hypothetical protein IFM89_006091 [Coptis chinensis]
MTENEQVEWGDACEDNMTENEQVEWDVVCEDDEPRGGVIGDEVYEIEKDMNIYCPCEGMEFDSLEEAYVFYNNYVGHIGFSVRIEGTS